MRRACLYANVKRDVYIELLKEEKLHGIAMLGKWNLCPFGTRDAAKGWQETLSPHLTSI